MQRNELILTFLLTALILAGSAYQTLRGGPKNAEIIVSRPAALPFAATPGSTAPGILLPQPTTPAALPPPGAQDPALVFLNQATVEQFKEVGGIGDAYANRILEARTRLGGFQRFEQVLQVEGIGEKTAQRIREYALARQTQPTPSALRKMPQAPIVPPRAVQSGKPAAPRVQRSTGGKRDLNQATREELLQVPGIGEQTAELILQERDTRRGFRSWQELDAIAGIGEKRLELLRERFEVGK